LVKKFYLVKIVNISNLWPLYLYAAIGLSALCIGIPLFLVYWFDKKRKTSHKDVRRRIGEE